MKLFLLKIIQNVFVCAQILQKEAEWPDGYILFSIFTHW